MHNTKPTQWLHSTKAVVSCCSPEPVASSTLFKRKASRRTMAVTTAGAISPWGNEERTGRGRCAPLWFHIMGRKHLRCVSLWAQGTLGPMSRGLRPRLECVHDVRAWCLAFLSSSFFNTCQNPGIILDVQKSCEDRREFLHALCLVSPMLASYITMRH